MCGLLAHSRALPKSDDSVGDTWTPAPVCTRAGIARGWQHPTRALPKSDESAGDTWTPAYAGVTAPDRCPVIPTQCPRVSGGRNPPLLQFTPADLDGAQAHSHPACQVSYPGVYWENMMDAGTKQETDCESICQRQLAGDTV
jgi:hypothetical protein